MRGTTILILAAACGGGGNELPIEHQCNPLGANHCMTPWPNSAFEVDDASTATGKRLAIPDKTLPTNIDDIATDPTGWNRADGFSPAAPMVMAFPGGVSASGLVPPENMDRSLAADAPTVIIDMTTHARVAHFAEVDVPAESTPDSQALFLRPAQRLVGGHRYAVAITTRVHAKDGGALPVPPGFVALRDNKSTDHPLLEAIRPRFAEVLDELATAGFAKDDLVVAWDFTVASDAFIRSDTTAAVARARTAMDTHPITFSITSDTQLDDGNGHITRRIEGAFDAPLFLSNGGGTNSGTRIVRDADGLPALQGFYRVPFVAIVPACAKTAPQPVGMVMYGHGLLGSANETAGGVQQTTAAELCMVFAGTDMRGMSGIDVPAVAIALNEMSHADEVMEVLEQGIVNHAALERAMRTTFADTLFVDGAKQLVDRNKLFYYGISQGGIFGTAVVGYLRTIPRAVLGVGAANYSMLLERSTDWPTYRIILNGAYPDALDTAMGISLFQMRWDKVEGSGLVNDVLNDGHGPPLQILVQIAIGDEQVPNIGSYWLARSMGFPVLDPSPFAPWGVPVTAGPHSSALVIMDGGAPPVPSTNIPATNVGMHSMPRKQPATRRQINGFFTTGTIVNECAGACLCATTACQ